MELIQVSIPLVNLQCLYVVKYGCDPRREFTFNESLAIGHSLLYSLFANSVTIHKKASFQRNSLKYQ